MDELIYKAEAMRRLKATYDGRVAGLRDKDDLFAEGIERTLDFAAGIEYAMEIIGNIKAVDAVPVIRCKDCKYSRELNHEDPKERQFIEGCVWCMNWEYGVFPDDYCSNAKRREDENNGTHQ